MEKPRYILLSDELWGQAKAKAALAGISLRQWVIDAIIAKIKPAA